MTDPTAGGNAGTAGGGDFLAGLPADIRGDGTLKGFAGADGGAKLAKSYTELVRAHSSRNMADMDPPKDDAGRRAVLSKLGHAPPERPDEYKLPDKPSARQFRDLAHKHGLTVKQAEGLFGDFDGAETRTSADRKARMETRVRESTEALRKEWGTGYDANMELFKRGMEQFMPEDVRSFLDLSGYANHPAVVKHFSAVGRALKEGTMHVGTGPAGGPANAAGFQSERFKVEQQMVTMEKAKPFDPTSGAYRELVKQRSGVLAKESAARIAEANAAAGSRP